MATGTRTRCTMISIQKLQVLTSGNTIAGPAAVQEKILSVLGIGSDGIDFSQNTFDFLLICGVHKLIIGPSISRVDCQLTCRDKRPTDFIQCRFSRLHQRNRHLGVIDRLFQTGGLCTHLF